MHQSPELAHFAETLSEYESIGLDEMESVQLLDRVDTKFLLHQHHLWQALQRMHADYRVLEVNGIRLNRYRSLYFDTPDFTMYTRHHSGGQNRYKVRCRQYVDSSLAYLEVKFKSSKRRTIKRRRQIDQMMTTLSQDAQTFVSTHCPYDAQHLQPTLWNEFVRITLVSKTQVERLTLDLRLCFRRNRIEAHFADITIAEVKQPKFSVQSAFVRQMRAYGVRPTGFSKYCMGAARLYPYLKQNRFKEKFLRMARLQKTLDNNPINNPALMLHGHE